MLFLFLLSLLGGALLAVSTLELRVGDNYKTATGILYLAEAGIEDGRELLRTSTLTPSQLLAAAAGGDGTLADSRDPDVLLASGDTPLIESRLLHSVSGQTAGRYFVFIRNDLVDGAGRVPDTNSTLSLLSVGVIGPSRKVLEAVVTRSGFPKLPSAITVGVAEPGLDPRLKAPITTERLVAGIVANATEIHDAGLDQTVFIGDVGNPSDYRTVIVNGDCEFGPGTGYGILLVRGELTMVNNFSWNGLVLVIGQGVLHWPMAAYGGISGAVFVARTRASDRSITNPLGSVLSDAGLAAGNFEGDGFVDLNQAAIDRANQRFPYVATSYREY